MKPVIILGSGGHAKVLIAILRSMRINMIAISDPALAADGYYAGGISVLNQDDDVFNYGFDEIELVNGIGSLPRDAGVRVKLFHKFQNKSYRFKTVVDPRALISNDVKLAQGVQVLTGAILQPDVNIQENTIINSGAIIEHDCKIGKHVHIAPGAVLSGGVEIGDNVHIGTGACLIQGIKVGHGSIVGAGVVLNRDLAAGKIAYPSRPLIKDL